MYIALGNLLYQSWAQKYVPHWGTKVGHIYYIKWGTFVLYNTLDLI